MRVGPINRTFRYASATLRLLKMLPSKNSPKILDTPAIIIDVYDTSLYNKRYVWPIVLNLTEESANEFYEEKKAV